MKRAALALLLLLTPAKADARFCLPIIGCARPLHFHHHHHHHHRNTNIRVIHHTRTRTVFKTKTIIVHKPLTLTSPLEPVH